MICEVLLPMLRASFPSRDFHAGSPPDPIVVFPAAHPEVGDVSIWDDGDEATVAVGEITHGHFNSYDASLTPEEAANRVAEDVVAFLGDLFADRVLLWKTPGSGAGGWRVLGQGHNFSLMDADDLTYFWSGPAKNPLRGGAG